MKDYLGVKDLIHTEGIMFALSIAFTTDSVINASIMGMSINAFFVGLWFVGLKKHCRLAAQKIAAENAKAEKEAKK